MPRRAVLVAVLVLVLAGCGASEVAEVVRPPSTGVCERALSEASDRAPVRLSTFEVDVRDAQQFRRGFGFRADHAYVVRLARNPSARARADVDSQGIPLSKQERRYLNERARVEDETSALRGYLATVPGLSGGLSIEDDAPRHPFVLLRITRPLSAAEARHLSSRARRYRLRQVRYSERHLATVSAQISDVIDSPGSQLQMRTLGVDIDHNAVELEYYSPTATDADALKRRFGSALISKRLPIATPVCVALTSYQASADGRTLTLLWRSKPDLLIGDPVVEAHAHGSRVVVDVVDYLDARMDPATFDDARTAPREATVRLPEPLGARRVVAARDGKTLPNAS